MGGTGHGVRRVLICLGGDHAIAHPIMRAVRRRQPNLTILHIDAHPDNMNTREIRAPIPRPLRELWKSVSLID
jgi:arginase family enzyme